MKKSMMLIALLLPTLLFARQHEEPRSMHYALHNKSSIETIEIPAVDIAKSLEKNVYKDYQGKPLRFANPNIVDVKVSSNGGWTSVPGGEIWQLRFTSENATDINFGITEFNVPKGVELHFLSFADKPTYFDGPYTSDDNKSHNQLWSAPLPGGDVGLELFVPTGVSKDFGFNVTSVNTGFRDVFKRNGGSGLNIPKQGTCNNDVVCPVGDDWRDEIRSVAAYTISGTDTCTGTLIMDAERSFRPFFLTAFHCGISTGNAAQLVTIWNYESANCGDLSGGSRLDTVSGATFLASRQDVDSSLIELSSTPPEEFGVHWAGWDNSGDVPSGSVGIHHPGVDEKAISFNNDALTTRNSCIATSTNTHWNVDNWEDGTTEPGSSGSGLWDPDNHRLVGFLSGGAASCSNIDYDCYGKFSEAWDNGGADNQNLKPWLDPNDTGVTGIDGSDGTPFAVMVDSSAVAVCSPADAVYNLTIGQNDPMFSEVVTLTMSGLPGSVADSFSVNAMAPPFSSVLTLSNTASAPAGSYMIDLDATSTSETISTTLELNISNGVPGSPVLSSPADAASNVSTSTTFSWNADPNANSYLIEVATDMAFSNVVISETTSDATLDSPIALDSSTTYYWRVTATNGCGVSLLSSEYSFTTVAAPGDCSIDQVANVLYEYDFESGLNGWSSSSNLSPAGSDVWSESGVSVNSGSTAMLAVNVGNVSDQLLTSPPVTIPNGEFPVSMSFWNRQVMEDQTGGAACFDGGMLEISTDNGVTFTQVADADLLTDPYNGPISESWENPAGGQDAWCGDPQEWLNSLVDFNNYAGQTVVFRFRMATDSSIAREGWYIDDVQVQSCQDTGVPVCDTPPPVGDPDIIWFNGFQCVAD